MTKSDLIEKLCQLQKLPKGRAELLVNCIFQCMEDSLKRGERIEIRGFGSFEIRNYKAYEGRNPRTGSTVTVQPKRLPFFKVGKELKDRVNLGTGVLEGDDESDGPADGHNGVHTPGTNGTHGANGTSAAHRAAASQPVAVPEFDRPAGSTGLAHPASGEPGDPDASKPAKPG